MSARARSARPRGDSAPRATRCSTRRRGPTSVSEVRYERHGSGEPLLLITGFAITSAVFEPVLDLYASRFECILYDHRGGLTTSIPELAADAARLLRSAGLDSAHV